MSSGDYEDLSSEDLQIILLFNQESNRNQLNSFLREWYDVHLPDEEDIENEVVNADLIIADGPALATHGEVIRGARNHVAPVYLPVLLAIPSTDIDSIPVSIWNDVDDIIERPITKRELRRRVRSLIRARKFSRDLKAQNERLEEFAKIVTHDLRNPLTVAKGYLDLAESEADPAHFERIRRSLTRMGEIIDDVLTLARTGTIVVDPEPVTFQALIARAWESVHAPDARLINEVNERTTLACDQSRTTELLENLFRNAIEHGGSTVKVRVGTLTAGDGWFIEDTGPGIEPANREQVFEYGYSSRDDGTGFGLAIVKAIVDAHGWEVAITTAAEGGARFEFTCGEAFQPDGHGG